ncbi:MAG: YgaP-like transmembrane domain [bacterium]
MKGNKVVRLMSFMVLISLIITHLTGQANLMEPTWLWLATAVSFMAFQATFTGFCPASKMLATNKDGEACCGK